MAGERKELHEVADGIHAYIQHDGSWGWSNSGLVVADGDALVVDTLFDLALTREMLDAYAGVLPAGTGIGTVVNSHGNGDHTFGNQLLSGARIVATRRTAEEMAEATPAVVAAMMRHAPQSGLAGEFLQRIFGPFEFEGIELTLPTETFDGELHLNVGGRDVRLIEVGPAHTRGDTIVWLPDERVVFTADILFVGAHPIMWAGPVENWLRALDVVLGLDAEVIVPGHGRLATPDDVRAVSAYLQWLDREARERHHAGVGVLEAARELADLSDPSWGESERVVANVDALYREYDAAGAQADPPAMFAAMAELDRLRR
jgi:glyoxylase-like metal-dependent hydrolase (beta-lactamase superfamily II)